MRQRLLLSILLTVFSSIAHAETIKLTIYDDGLSCPGGCDAHVVFHPSMNGTEFAHDPSTPNEPYRKCVNGQICTVCVESGLRQCLQVVYRGGGPPPNTFDFTPRFYESACSAASGQSVLGSKCRELERAAAGLANRINCIAFPASDGCRELIATAAKAQLQDRVEYNQCRASGEAAYNRLKPIESQRSLACAYERVGTGGPNSRGRTWKKLLPGACRDKTFVGRDGLDCCSGSTLADGPLGRECNGFYLMKPPT
jgi:hypothetical protein